MKYFILLIINLTLCIAATAQYNSQIIVEPILKTDTTTIGHKIIYPNFSNCQVTISRITIPPGQSTGWHKHEIPVFAYIIEGVLTVELENNMSMEFGQNSSFAEVIDTYHNGINKGNTNVILIAFFMGGDDKNLSIHKNTVE